MSAIYLSLMRSGDSGLRVMNPILMRIHEHLGRSGVKDLAELSRVAGVQYQTLANLRRRPTATMRLDNLSAIASALGISLADLLGGPASDAVLTSQSEDRELLDTYRRLSSRHRQSVRDFVRFLADQQSRQSE